MSSNYTIAFAGMPALLDEQEHVMENFTFERYPDSFKRYCNKHKATLKAVEDGYLQVIDKEQFLTNMAEELANSAEKRIAEEEKKNAKEKLAANLNMCLVIYTLPAVLEMNKAPANLFSKKILEAWKAHFPKTNLKASTFKQINSGFKRKFCYITTAACESQGKADNCYELELLRSYRDNYLLQSEEGGAMVKEYYNIAPTIVNRIARQENADAVYDELWNSYLMDCVNKIENGENEACRERYAEMVYDLKSRYMS